MEAGVGKSERRGRKRRRKDVQNVEVDQDGRKRSVVLKPKELVGRYVRKEFEGNGLFLGKIVFYDSGLYRVDYDDGDCEDLDPGELKEVLIEEDVLVGEWLDRKKKLNEMVASKEVKDVAPQVEIAAEPVSAVVDMIEEVPVLSDSRYDSPVKLEKMQVGTADSLSDLSEDDEEQDLSSEVEKTLVPAPELPPSSGNIGIPEEYVPYLLSIFSFLRTFSTTLFLSPFELDDFVGALNCSIPNSLLDSIHVAVMRVLRRHLENLSSDGSELASKCLRNIDWSLLDAMTWPVYLVHYLMGMGYTDEHGWKEFYPHTLEKEYYSLTAGRKLIVLQILCDSVLDSEELRAEIDMREESEVGIDSDGGTVFAPVIGPRRVHPRYAKTSACKDQEAIKLNKENSETNIFSNTNSLGAKVTGQASIRDIDQDGNGDECRLCGMDGTLLCCDGCPSSYHGRCIGVCKMYIPEGAWYCPECTVNGLDPKITRGTPLKGSEVFGVDSYGQVFMGTCNHLLVLKVLADSDCNVRYYYDKDIPKVLQALNTSVQHYALYLEICKGIIQYWRLPVNIKFPNSEPSEISRQGEGTMGGCVMAPLKSLVTESLGEENTACCVTEFGPGNALLGNFPMVHMQNEKLSAVSRPDGLFLANIDPIERQSNSPLDSLSSGQIQVKPIVCTGSVDQHLVPSEWTEQDDPNLVKTATHTSSHFNYLEQINGIFAGLVVSHGRGCLYMGSSFKPQGYINSYLHGDFAAAAAASLAVLSSEETQGSETRVSDKRKQMAASFLHQAKAFSSVAMRFFWPNMEKKLVEVPRERCSWCLSCKAPVASKRGCLLNAAASNAIKGPMKILSGLRPAKGGEGSLPGIATYIILMEESLIGLIGGAFQSAAFRNQWRKEAEEATSCSVIKSLLLELEENIRLVAFSVDWIKLVDGGSSESSVTQSATAAVGSTHKRKPGRRGRKPMAIVEATADDSQDLPTDFTWWRGGLISKFILQKGTLPQRMVKKAALQGGVKKIPGIYYAEGSETAKRSRQLVWRAAVDMCKTTSQLALQVRYLDMHVRWSDLVRPEQSVQDGKGPETEASAFRNAYICDKRVVENEIRYGVAFGNQKHLPSRVMKSVAEVEQTQDGKERYWFSELRIPLYLIKEYEEKIGKDLASADKCTSAFMQKKTSRAPCTDIFSYLVLKRDGNDKYCCASCQADVSVRYVVKCNACQGLCHEHCTVSSTVDASSTCKQCNQNRALFQAKCSDESPTSPLLLQGQYFPKPISANKGVNVGSLSRPSASVATLKHSSAMKHSNSSKSKSKANHNLGVIWRKKSEDTGTDFVLRNILLKGNPDGYSLIAICHLCRNPYNPDLMYIRCETCSNWFHADAVGLEESKIHQVMGFKCSRCRRTRIPICPYLDPKSKKQIEEKRTRARASKMDNSGMEFGSGMISELHMDDELSSQVLPSEEDSMYLEDDNSLLVSTSEEFSEQFPEADCEWNTATMSVFGPKKLPVRRQVKNENDLDSSFASDPFHADFFGGDIMISAEEIPVNAERGTKLPVRRNGGTEKDLDTLANNPTNVELSTPFEVEWDTSRNGFDDGLMFEYDDLQCDDMEFEPQTYFSFNELLASDDCGALDGSSNLTDNGDTSLGFPSDGLADLSYFQHEHALGIDSAAVTVSCKVCSHTKPCPDLCCQMCGIWIHSHCSPWVEELFGETGWMCGNCRDWR